MQFIALFSTVLLAASAFAVPARYDTWYDNAEGSLNSVACSNGQNGLVSRFPTFGTIPTFPNIGAASAVTGWNSPACGSCWNVTYAPENTNVLVTAVDHADEGFNLSLEALNTLTDGRAEEFGVVDVTAVEVPRSACGL